MCHGNQFIAVYFIPMKVLWEKCAVAKLLPASQNNALKIPESPCTVRYTENITDLPKVSSIDTTNLKPVRLINTEFGFYAVTSIRGFTSILTIVCAKTSIIWVIPNAPKISPVRIIIFILTTLKNEKHSCRHVIVDEDGALENSTYVTNLLVEKFSTSM